MPHPFSHLFLHNSFSIAISGPHIQLLDSAQGNVLFSTCSDLIKSGPIRCAAVDPHWTYIATCADDKLLKVWKIGGLELFNQRQLPKKPTNIVFTKDSQTIVVSDKFGDVFSYPLQYTPPTGKQKRDVLSSHENPSGGKLILGHASVLTTFLLSQEEDYIITADRDEHIRVSWYPQGFVIEMYCLGHEKYVSAIHVPQSSPSILVSGGGDPMLKIWHWESGMVQYEIPILDAVQPFIAVAPKPKRGDDEDEDETQSKGKRKGKRRNRGKKQKEKATEKDDRETSDTEEEADSNAIDMNVQPRQVLVIHKIASMEHAGEPYVIFCAVGTTALFACPLKPGAEIRSFDLKKPVLDFTIYGNGFIWTLLDDNWLPSHQQTGQERSTATSASMVRVLHLTSSGELAELTSSQLGTHAPLLTSLNTTCLLPATAGDLKKLELYADLTWLPKHDGGIDPESGDKHDHVVSDPLAPPTPEIDEEQAKQMTKRELARLKNKRKVQTKAQEVAGKVSGKVLEGMSEEQGGVSEEEPTLKKRRSENEENSVEVDDTLRT